MMDKIDLRKIELKGAYNFRDVGGYSTKDEKKIKRGKLFRSDNLAKLTRGDLHKIEKLNLQLIIDLRSKEERISKPNRLPSKNGIKIENIEIVDNKKSHNELKREIFYGKSKERDLEKEILSSYRLAITDYRCELKKIFELLLNPANYTALVLCNSGKDRTGVVMALALMSVGVSKKNILKDYMLSQSQFKTDDNTNDNNGSFSFSLSGGYSSIKKIVGHAC
ncbi:putative protein tyrosine/serine phosphatase [Desulfosarcina variabilis str. Montpellier]|uniref:tyrosine-protein phosphatase n=1 Tax=Desulfosarcina variabilis TaxID=2300 RepID=UPI003AFA0357